MTKTLFQIVSEVMNIPIVKISDSSGPESIPEWDSFNMFVLLAEIEKEFNVNFSLALHVIYVIIIPRLIDITSIRRVYSERKDII